MAYPGFGARVLCGFRQRLVAHQAERRVFKAFLRRLKGRGFLKGRAVQRAESLAIIAAVRELDLLESVMETLRPALEAIAQHDPAWREAHVSDDWLQHSLSLPVGGLTDAQDAREVLGNGQYELLAEWLAGDTPLGGPQGRTLSRAWGNLQRKISIFPVNVKDKTRTHGYKDARSHQGLTPATRGVF